MSLPPLIPREVLFGNPTKGSPLISPDGKHLAWLAPDDKNVMQVWARPMAGGEAKKITDDKKRGIRSYGWTFTPGRMVFLQDKDGDENWHLYAINLDGGAAQDLTPFDGVTAQSMGGSHKHPTKMLVGLNKENKEKHDIYLLDIVSGDLKMVAANPGNHAGSSADMDLVVRSALRMEDDAGSTLLLRKGEGDEWKEAFHWGPDDEGGTGTFSPDGKKLWLSASHNANASRLLEIDLETMKETVIAEDPEYDIGGTFRHPETRELQAYSFYKEKNHWTYVDPEFEKDFRMLQKVREGEVFIASRDHADTNWIVGFSTDDGPAYFYTFDRKTKKTEFLFSNRPELEEVDLVHMEPMSYVSRDGLTVHGYLTKPKGVEIKNLPAVLVVHGGPWVRDEWGMNPEAQWLANRGYVVLQVNFRGSTGYGKMFLNAGNKQWGLAMQDDLTDAVGWLVETGMVDPKRIGIYGGSYGGYAALAGLAFTPDLYAAGVDLVGPSNLLTLLKSVPPYWKPQMAIFDHRMGRLKEDEKFLKSISPLFSVDKIKKPLLIAQGKHDPRVNQAESEQIVDAMRKADLPVEYWLYEDEGHGFARPPNRIHFYAQTEAFLAKHLGGRAEAEGEIVGHNAVQK